MEQPKYISIVLTLSILSLLSFSSGACADVFVYDMFARQGQTVMLRIETKGMFFSRGGRVIELFVEGKALGAVLSGGDGLAFREFTPRRTGVYRIHAKSGGEEGNGLLVSLKKGAAVVLVDIEGSMLESAFSSKIKEGSANALKEINRRFPVILMQTGMLGLKNMKALLKENGIADMPVVSWEEGNILEEISKGGFVIKAVIGSPEIIDSAKRCRPLLLSFEETEDAQTVADWKEIGKKLK